MQKRRLQRLKQVAKNRVFDIIAVFEDIYDPHNALASFRNLDAFGIQQVHLIFEKQEPFDPVKLGRKTSSSANKWLDFTVWNNTKQALTALKDQGFYIIASAIDKNATKLTDFKYNPKQKLAVVFGNEHAGISKTVKDLADELVYIPMVGMVQSFNLSVSVGIIFYELFRQRLKYQKHISSKATVSKSLTPAQKKLFTRWYKRDLGVKNF